MSLQPNLIVQSLFQLTEEQRNKQNTDRMLCIENELDKLINSISIRKLVLEYAKGNIDLSNWSPMIELSQFKPYPAMLSIMNETCPITVSSFAELAQPYISTPIPRRYFIVMLEASTEDNIAICDGNEGYKWLCRNFTNPLTNKAVNKVHYYVTDGSPVFKHFETLIEANLKAIEHYLSAESLDSSEEIQRARIEVARVSKNKDHEFVRIIRLLLNDDPKNEQAIVMLEVYINTNPTIEKIHAVKDYFNNNEAVQNLLGSCCYNKLDDYIEAERCYRQALAINPKSVKACSGIAYSYKMRKNFQKALSFMDKAISLDDKNPFFIGHLADMYLLIGDLDNAELHIRKAMELGKTHENRWLYYNVVAITFLLRRNFKEAQNYAEESLKINPTSEWGHFVKAVAHKEKGEFRLAKAHIEAAIKQNLIEVGNAEFGDIYRLQGNLVGAEKHLTIALNHEEKLPVLGYKKQVHQYFARLYIAKKDMAFKDTPPIDKAFIHINLALQHDKSDPVTHTILGAIHEIAGDSNNAKIALKRALELDPQNFEANAVLGKIYKNEKQYSEARMHLEVAAAIGKCVEVLESLGEVYEATGEIKLARTKYEEVIKLNEALGSKNDDIYARLGAVHIKLKDFKNAETQLEMALCINEVNALALANLEILHLEKARMLNEKRSKLKDVQVSATLSSNVAAISAVVGSVASSALAAISSSEKEKDDAFGMLASLAAQSSEKEKDDALSHLGSLLNRKVTVLSAATPQLHEKAKTVFPGKTGLSYYLTAEKKQDKTFTCSGKGSFVLTFQISLRNEKWGMWVVFKEINDDVVKFFQQYGINFDPSTRADSHFVSSSLTEIKAFLEIMLANHEFQHWEKMNLEKIAKNGKWPSSF